VVLTQEPSAVAIAVPETSAIHVGGVQFGFEGLIAGRGQRAEIPRSFAPRKRPLAAAAPSRASPIRIGVAQSTHELKAAELLVRQRYSWRGYQVDGIDAAAVSAAQRAPHEITFVAMDEHAAVGTITLGLDGPTGLRAEETHGDRIVGIRSTGRRVCELTRLAIATHPESRSVLTSLFGHAYASGRTVHGVTDAFIEVNPRHVGFYTRVLGFAVAAAEKFCERVCAPSVLLHLEIDTLEERLRMLGFAAAAGPLLAEVA
jgi:hypothetical protein